MLLSGDSDPNADGTADKKNEDNWKGVSIERKPKWGDSISASTPIMLKSTYYFPKAP